MKMMTLAFILGVLPLVTASGAGASARQALGTSVFTGMIAATFLGLGHGLHFNHFPETSPSPNCSVSHYLVRKFL